MFNVNFHKLKRKGEMEKFIYQQHVHLKKEAQQSKKVQGVIKKMLNKETYIIPERNFRLLISFQKTV